VFVAEGKGGHQRLVPVSRRFFDHLAAYLEFERPLGVHTDRVFVVLKGPNRGKPLSAKGLDEVLAGARRRAGLPHATCHELRHTCLTRLREAGMALEAVQAQAGHAPSTTRRPAQGASFRRQLATLNAAMSAPLPPARVASLLCLPVRHPCVLAPWSADVPMSLLQPVVKPPASMFSDTASGHGLRPTESSVRGTWRSSSTEVYAHSSAVYRVRTAMHSSRSRVTTPGSSRRVRWLPLPDGPGSGSSTVASPVTSNP
jgi:hypothetical protein